MHVYILTKENFRSNRVCVAVYKVNSLLVVNIIKCNIYSAFLFQKNQWDPERAVEHMRSRRPHILLHTKQWSALETFYKNHVNKTSKANS